ncbi:hypothetical protein OG339_39485 [Streptosporangium sp. NBC_01495]|uniref:hypothetical protein n=1 Tax=Streptosporangium sp. NBC_01495 TaxID=2903899 RepID=UPI002E2EDDC6|nr:hypothetical protein [Streptosporangium sp. NBC_01495]
MGVDTPLAAPPGSGSVPGRAAVAIVDVSRAPIGALPGNTPISPPTREHADQPVDTRPRHRHRGPP